MHLFFILFLSCIAHAGFNINPFILKLNVSRGEHIGWLETSHSGGSDPVAVELVMHERILDIDGNVKDTVIPTKDFVILPARILLYPKESAKTQIIYRGKQKVDADKAYFLHAREIPLPQRQEYEEAVRANFSVLVNYNVLIAMETNKPSSLSFVSSRNLSDGFVELIMENKGKGHFTFEDVYIYIGKEKITDFTGRKNSVMPGQQRRFIFKHHKAPTSKEVRFGK
ncbi:MAG: hypothetical protein LBC85_03045 [Fibromonadaceae bacterium]|jgi:P pilus assembly chaperone PapD|nr:hypothetical protein [Fibromonadaceae bacterium]